MFHLPSCFRTITCAGLAVIVVGASAAWAQTQTSQTVPVTPAVAATQPATLPQSSAPTVAVQKPTINVPEPTQAQPADQPTYASVAAKKTYEVPAGTKVLLDLKSSINTHSAKPGDGVYLTSTFPVVVGNRVMIPAGVYVQGVVDRVARGTRTSKSQLDMHFTSIIFPNGSVVEIPGMVNSLPGAKKQTVQDDGEGTIQQNGDKGRNAGETAKIALPTGAGVGTIGGAESGHPLTGGLTGLAAGAAAVGLVSLFTRNAEVDIPAGSQVEMILQRPLLLEDANLASAGASGSASTLVPAPNQPKPLDKPRILCPPGTLGCGYR